MAAHSIAPPIAFLFCRKVHPMADIVTQLNIGGIALPVSAIRPQSSTGGTVTGATIDRAQHNMSLSCVIHQNIGAVSGAPSAVAITSALQHSPDGSTWSAYTPGAAFSTPATSGTIAAANTDNATSVDLSSAYRYIRTVMTVTLTGGTTPAALVEASVVLGGEVALPAV